MEPRIENGESIVKSTGMENLTKQVAKGAGIAFTGQMTGKILSFLLQIILSRVLGASLYGIYALGYSVHNVVSQIFLLGLPNSVVRFGAVYKGEEDNQRLKGLLIFAIACVAVSGTVGALVLYFLAEPLSYRVFKEPLFNSFMKIRALGLPFYALITVFASSARAFRRIDYDVGLREVFHPFAKLVLIVIMFMLGERLIGAAFALLIAAAVAAYIGFRCLLKLYPLLISSLSSIYEVKKIITFAIGVLLIGFTYLWMSETDKIMLGYMASSKEVGIYNAAFIVAIQLTVFFTAFNAIFAPVIADLYNKKEVHQFENVFKMTTKWVIILTLPVYIGLIFFAEPIMGLFGSEFRVAWTVLISLATAQIVNVSVGGVAYILTMTGHQWLELGNGIAVGITNIILNYILIQRYGAFGAALATGFSLMTINLVRLLEVHYLFRIHPYKMQFLKPIIAGLFATGFGVIFKAAFTQTNWIWLAGCFCIALTYIAVMALLGLDSEDRLIWNAVGKRVGHLWLLKRG